jgi:type II secretory pathway pseudopilin PulG
MISRSHLRRGISLLEVLISMGILTIGLVSVLALIPAGRSQALKAGALDRSVALAQNAAADFITRGFLRPAGWGSAPTGSIAIFDPLDKSGFWGPLPGVSVLAPRVDAPTFATSGNVITAAGSMVSDILMRGEDDVRFSTDKVGDDDPPLAIWAATGTTGRRVFDGSFSYLAMLSGSGTTWIPGDYKTLTIVTFNRRDVTRQPVTLTANIADGVWNVVQANVPDGMALKDLIKPGAMVLYKSAGGAMEWKRVLLAADATLPAAPSAWRIGLTCEGTELIVSNPNEIYVFPGANGSLQMPVRLEGTSPWND